MTSLSPKGPFAGGTAVIFLRLSPPLSGCSLFARHTWRVMGDLIG